MARILIISGTPWYAHAGHQAPTQIAIAFRQLGHDVLFHYPIGHKYAVCNFYDPDYFGVQETDAPVECDLCVVEAPPQPLVLEAVRTARPLSGRLLYRSLDLWEGWIRDACGENYLWEPYEREIIQLSDRVCAVSEVLAHWTQQRFDVSCQVIANGSLYADYVRYSKLPKDKIAVYIGNKLDSIRIWRDIEFLADAYPEWLFYAVGFPATTAHYTSGNFFSLPELGEEKLAGLYSAASIGLVAHRRSWFCYFADPTKWYLYNACGMIVASTNCAPHLTRPYTACSDDLQRAFAGAVAIEQQVHDRSVVPQPMNDWTHRALEMLELGAQ